MMGHKLSQKDSELYKRVDEILHYIWDPIGISDSPYARNEYHPYFPRVFSLLKSSATSKEISDFLIEIEREHMGLKPSEKKAGRVAEILLEYKKKILEE